jgi:putative ABC transport system permease protein
MAVGARRVDMLVQFLVEAETLALMGGGLGIVFGFGAALSVPRFVAGAPLLSALPGLATVATPMGSSVMVGLVAGAYPAYRASRLNPIEALRSE